METKAAVLDRCNLCVEIVVGIIRAELQYHDRRLEQEPEFVERTDLLGESEAPDAEIDDACLCGELLCKHGGIFFGVVDPGAEGEGSGKNNDVREIREGWGVRDRY